MNHNEFPVGAVVTPISPMPPEVIVGIIINRQFVEEAEVMWLSNMRGVFTCTESATDLALCDLSERENSGDTLLDHATLAAVILKQDSLDMGREYSYAIGEDEEIISVSTSKPGETNGEREVVIRIQRKGGK